MQRLATLEQEITTWRDLENQASSLTELLEMSLDEDAGEVANDIATETAELTKTVGELEFQLVFSGTHDDRNAIFAIHAGAGGSDSQDWAQMLLRMYLRWAERKKCKATILDSSPGEETGIKSATAVSYTHLTLPTNREV